MTYLLSAKIIINLKNQSVLFMPAVRQATIVDLLPLFFVLIIDAMGWGLIIPTLSPLLTQQVGGILPPETSAAVRDIWYGLMIAGFSVAFFWGAPFLGDLSDHWGRKKVLLICLLGTALGSLICGIGIVWQSITILLIGRCFSGYVAGSQAIAQAVIADISTKENKAQNMGLMILAVCVGFILGPLLGGYFADHQLVAWFNYSTPFFVDAILAAFNAAYLWWAFKETFYPKQQTKVHWAKGLTVFLNAFKRVEIRVLSAVLLLEQLGFVIYFMYVSLFLVQEFSYTERQIGHFIAYLGVIWAITQLIVLRLLLKFFNEKKIIVPFLALAALGLVGAMLRSEVLQWIVAIPIAMADILIYTELITLFSNQTSEEGQGEMMGITGAVAAAAWGLAGLLAGFAIMVSITFPFLLAALSMLLALGLFRRWHRRYC